MILCDARRMVLALCGMLLAASCGNAEVTAPKSSPLQLKPCTVEDVKEQVFCGTMTVPENRLVPNGRSIDLRVVKLPARQKGLSNPPVFYFAGGPGEAATEYASYLADHWERDRNDIVLVDQRGTGPGHRLDCPLRGSDQDLQGYFEPKTPQYASCADLLRDKVDLTQYVTKIVALDTDEVRRALGYEKVIVEGGSYGAKTAIVYTKLFGEHVHAALLTGVPSLDPAYMVNVPANVQKAFDQLIAECASDAECHRKYPDPAGDLAAVLQRLDRGNVTAVIQNPVTKQPATVSISKTWFTESLFSAQMRAEGAQRLPRLLSLARQGEFSEFAEQAVSSLREERKWIARGLFLAVVCNEEILRIPPEQIEPRGAGTYLGGAFVGNRVAACARWPRAALSDSDFAPFRTDVPALIIAGDKDPITPPEEGRKASAYFPNSLVLIVPAAHSLPDNQCLEHIGRELFAGVAPAKIDSGCSERMAKLRF